MNFPCTFRPPTAAEVRPRPAAPNKKAPQSGAHKMSRDGLEPSTLGLKGKTLQIPALTELRAFLETPAHGAGRDLPAFGVPLRLTRRVLSVFIIGRRDPRSYYHAHPITNW